MVIQYHHSFPVLPACACLLSLVVGLGDTSEMLSVISMVLIGSSQLSTTIQVCVCVCVCACVCVCTCMCICMCVLGLLIDVSLIDYRPTVATSNLPLASIQLIDRSHDLQATILCLYNRRYAYRIIPNSLVT